MQFALSNPAVPGNYIGPVKGAGEFLVAYEMGSMKLQDPSGGLLQQVWRLESDGQSVYISSPTQSPLFLFSDEYITEIDLAFDQNMLPFVVYVCAGGAVKFRWYDSRIAQYVTNSFVEPVVSPRCTLDDKRLFDIGNSDIVLAYVDLLTGWLCYRLQRDRYSVIYPLCALDYGMRLRCIGFTDQNRVQMSFDDLTPVVALNLHKGLANYTRPISIKGDYIT